MEFNEEDYLQLSGIQHFLYCRRQWALIHIENQWAENYRTTDGEIMHKNAHNPLSHTRREDTLIVRGLKIKSRRLGISGECDIVEFHAAEDGISLAKTSGKWKPFPVEYKRGVRKNDIYDKAQLCAQALCLEEMFLCHVESGALYYGEEHHRQEVEFTDALRKDVESAFFEMHNLMKKGYTPAAVFKSGCHACSLYGLCVPELEKREPVSRYMRRMLEV